MPVVDVPRYLLPLVVFISDEDDGVNFPLRTNSSRSANALRNGDSSRGRFACANAFRCFTDLFPEIFKLLFLALKLLAFHGLRARPAETELYELSRHVLVLQIIEIQWLDLMVEIVLVGVELRGLRLQSLQLHLQHLLIVHHREEREKGEAPLV